MSLLEPNDQIVELRAIRKALNLGLATFAEVERLRSAKAMHDQVGTVFPDDLRPTDFLGNASGAALFAEALTAVQLLEDDAVEHIAIEDATQRAAKRAQSTISGNKGAKAH
jgi:hypothetical protein